MLEKEVVYLHQWHRRLYEQEAQGGAKGRYRLTVDEDTMEVKVFDVDPLIQRIEADQLDSSNEKEVKSMQFTVVNGLNYEPNTVSLKCVNEVEGETLYMYENEEFNSMCVGPWNPEDGNFADHASFKMRFAFFSYSDNRNCSLESSLNKRHFIYSCPETRVCRMELYDGSEHFMIHANWQIMENYTAM